jgi:O-methyltransferase
MTKRLLARYEKLLTWLTLPVVVAHLLDANRKRLKPVSQLRIFLMSLKTTLTSHRVQTASHYYEHLTMIAALLGTPEDTPGVVVECGCFKGGSTINLSLGCALAGRELSVYDSFQGLPEPEKADLAHMLLDRPVLHAYEAGMYSGGLEEVRANVARYGKIDVCSFHPGFFSDSMADFSTPCVVAFVDVDLRSSLEDCVRALWPNLVDGGAIYIHEAEHREMVDLFYDQEWWNRELGVDAPGLVGGGTGLGLEPRDGVWRSGLAFTVKNPLVREYVTVAG